MPDFIGTNHQIPPLPANPDRAYIFAMSQETTRAIWEELRKAWRALGAAPDLMPDVSTGTGLYEAFQRAGASPQLLAVIGSYRDTTEDATVLEWLRLYNAGKPIIAREAVS
jgi:uroporphyrinogen-III synthase